MTDDTNIITFPTHGSTSILSAISSRDPVARMVLDKMSFTCTTCQAACTADLHNVVFRSMELHCRSCGQFFRITNPAFSTVAKPRR